MTLTDCPQAPRLHTTRLEYDVHDNWCDGIYEHIPSVPMVAIAIGTALALQGGAKVVCVPRAVRPESETQTLESLGYRPTGNKAPSRSPGEFVLRHMDYLNGAGNGGYVGETYLEDFAAQSAYVIGVDVAPQLSFAPVAEARAEAA